MTKRSGGWVRSDRDYYPTPRAAAEVVLPWLRLEDGVNFAEPCCGDGRLVGHLMHAGFEPIYVGDIADGYDAMTWHNEQKADFVISNPPWNRPVLHPMIGHLVSLGVPTWLLLDADWAHTIQAVPFLRYCTHIVSIGRVKWIEGSDSVGYDNCAWYRFSEKTIVYPTFIPRKPVFKRGGPSKAMSPVQTQPAPG